jgi:hypothetical protein
MGIQVLSPLDDLFKTFKAESSGFNQHLRKCLKDPDSWEYVHEQAKLIRGRDLAMVDHSNFLICVLDPSKPTFGTIDEIITAKRASKPVFLVVPELGYSGIPIWLSSYFKPNWVYSSLAEVFQVLKKIDNEPPENLNNKYWKILR